MVTADTRGIGEANERSHAKLDPVAQRLSAAGEQQSPSVLEWLDSQQQRDVMRRRAVVCIAGGWLLMTMAAIVSSAVALHLSHDVKQILQGEVGTEIGVPNSVVLLPLLLVAIAVFLVVGGIVGWIIERIPGFSKTIAAIDWSSASDAVRRLLSAGCTYPEAFRTAARVTRSKPSRNWLIQAADRVERGGPEVAPSRYSSGDAAVLELLIDAAKLEPQRQWRVAADHFWDLSRRRLVLLLQSTPIIATIISGLLVWIAISATLGWMWRAVAEMIQGFGF